MDVILLEDVKTLGKKGQIVKINDKKKLTLDVPIKALGNYMIQIKLHKDVTAELTVKVVEK